MSSTQPALPVTIVLASPSDWDEWLAVVKSKALTAEIWQFINPATDKEQLPTLKEPAMPTSTTVNPAKSPYAELDATETMQFKALLAEYKRRVSKHDQQATALRGMCTFIQGTISRNYFTFTMSCDTAYDMLVALKHQVAPTNHARKMELLAKYQKLKKAPRTQGIETWLQQWEKTYQDCKDLKLANVEHDQPQYDFLHAASSVSPEFANYWLVNLESKTYDGTPLPDIYALIEQFWNNYRASSIRSKAAQGTFPAIF